MNTNQLVESHIPFANKIASRQKASLPKRISLEELKSAAYMGLVQAAGRFDATKGTFTTFAYSRIFGAIIDYLRECGMPLVSLDSQYEDDGCTFAEVVSAPEVSHVEEVFEAITADLDEKAKVVLRNHLLDDLPMKEVGLRLGVTESRVSQLISGYKKVIQSRWTYGDLAA
jgi:RNA polymerase sigma factor (sigma-70 family)